MQAIELDTMTQLNLFIMLFPMLFNFQFKHLIW